MMKVRVDKVEAIRWAFIVVLALIIAHLFDYNKLPVFFSDYKFPIKMFMSTLFFGAAICQTNTSIFRKLNNNTALKNDIKKRIILQFTYIWLATIVIFSILFIGINGVLLNKEITFYSFSFFLIIGLFISTFEALVLNLLMVYKLYKESDIISKKHLTGEAGTEDIHYITIKTVTNITNLELEKVAYINSKNGIVIIEDVDTNKYITQFTSLNEIIDLFPANLFFRVNRQYLLNKRIIKNLEEDVNQKLNVYLKEDFIKSTPFITCSRYKSKEMKDWFS